MRTTQLPASAVRSDWFLARLMRSTRPVRAGWAGGLYDVLITGGFATPWTAAFILGLLATAQETAGLPGDPMPSFDVSHVLFVTLFGVVVTMWGVVRMLRPTALLTAVDTAGRGVFSLYFIWALLQGHSTVIVAFLALELTWLVVQAVGVRRALRLDREEEARAKVGFRNIPVGV